MKSHKIDIREEIKRMKQEIENQKQRMQNNHDDDE